MKLDLISLLEDLTQRFPPGEKQRHAVTLADKEMGPKAKLRLTLFQGKFYIDIVVTAEDLERETVEVRDEIMALLLAEGFITLPAEA